MADYDNSYKDLSELKNELDGMKSKSATVQELSATVQKLSETVTDMMEVFGAAVEQMKIEEMQYEADKKKHESLVSKLDKLIDQNRTIAEGMVAIVEMVKSKTEEPKIPRRIKAEQEQRPGGDWRQDNAMAQPQRPQQMPQSIPQARQPVNPLAIGSGQAPSAPQPIPNPFAQQPVQQPVPFESQKPMQLVAPNFPGSWVEDSLPPVDQLEQSPMPDFDLSNPDAFLDEEAPKKKSLFGMFKK